MKKLANSRHPKVWGSPRLSPWFEDSENLATAGNRGGNGEKIGEIWFDPPPDVPLLVKFLFTTENLSVQVHPEDSYARTHHGPAANGKTEMWHILRTDPGARIALGLREPVTREALREASLSGAIMDLLHWIGVKPGDTFFVPAGTIHAIGAGVALCEIQQISDITYRLYDYGRDRELHLGHGIAVSNLEAYAPADLGQCRYFRTHVADADAAGVLEIAAPAGTPAILIAVSGGEALVGGHPSRPGDVWHLPEGRTRVEALAPARFLLTYVPRYSE